MIQKEKCILNNYVKTKIGIFYCYFSYIRVASLVLPDAVCPRGLFRVQGRLPT